MTGPETAVPEEELETVSILDYLSPLIRWRWLIFLGCAALGVLGILSALSKAPSYTASAYCMPRGALGEANELRALAGESGKDWAKARSAGEIVKYYSVALKVRPLMQTLLRTEFETAEWGRAPLLSVLMGGEDGEDPLEEAIVAARKTLEIESGGGKMLKVSFTSSEARLSADVVNTLLDEYAKLPRHSQRASADMQFIQERVRDVRTKLEQKEKEIAGARSKSLDSHQPDAVQRLAALEREARLLEKLYENLNAEHAKAEIRTIQSQQARSRELEILERAEPPFKRTGPNRRKIVLVYVFLGAVLTTAAAFTIEYFRNLHRVFVDHPFWRLITGARRDLIIMSFAAAGAVLLLVLYRLLRSG